MPMDLRALVAIVAGIAFFILALVANDLENSAPFGLLALLGIGLGGARLLQSALRARANRRAAAALGLRFEPGPPKRVEGELPDLGKVIGGEGARVGEHVAYEVMIGSRLPAMSEGLARALTVPRCQGWSWTGRAWYVASSTGVESPMSRVLELVAEGIALARTTLVAARMSDALRSALAEPEVAHLEPGSAPWRELGELVRALARDDAPMACRLARLVRDPELWVELAERDDEAFSELLRSFPRSEHARRAVDDWVARRGELGPHGLAGLAVALRKEPHREAEAVLVAMLDHADQEVRLKAITSLSEVGTPRCVPSLKQVAEHGAIEAHNAEEAITAIKQRVRGAEAGALAMADGSGAGALAVVPGEPRRDATPTTATD